MPHREAGDLCKASRYRAMVIRPTVRARPVAWLMAVIVVCLFPPVLRGDGLSFQDLGIVPNAPPGFNTTYARALSADGSTVLGSAGNGNFRWRREVGLQELTTLAGDQFTVGGVSSDGSVVVGSSNTRAARVIVEAGEPNLLQLLEQPAGATSTSANDASADGSVIVGLARTVDFSQGRRMTKVEPVRWTDGQLQVLPLDVGELATTVRVSNDGSVIAGPDADGLFRWDGGNITRVALTNGIVRDVSGDGSAIVGQSGGRPFRWTVEEGFQTISGVPEGSATSVSADGSIVAGFRRAEPNLWIWEKGQGVRFLHNILVDGGVDLTGWSLALPYLSDDGRTVAGTTHVRSNGTIASWIAHLAGPTVEWAADGIAFWDTAGSWDPQSVPGVGDTAVFQGVNYLREVHFGEENQSIGCLHVQGTGTVQLSGFLSNEIELTTRELEMGRSGGDDVTLQLTNLELNVSQANLGTVEGAPARLEVLSGGSLDAGILRVGAEEQSEMVIESGGNVRAEELFIARNDGNASKVSVRGGELHVLHRLEIGENRPGELVLEGGATLFVDLAADPKIEPGSRARVTGVGTRWKSAVSNLSVTDGTLDIGTRATAEVRDLTLLATDRLAMVNVDTGASLKMNSDLLVTTTETGEAIFSISDSGSRLDAVDVIVGSIATSPSSPDPTEPKTSSTLEVANGALAKISGKLTIGGAGPFAEAEENSVRVTSGATVEQTTNGVATRIQKDGLLEIDGGDSSWTSRFGDLEIDGGVTRISDQGQATFDKVRVFAAGSVAIDQATLTVNDHLTVGVAGGDTSGFMTLINGQVDVANEVFVHELSYIAGTGRLRADVIHVADTGFVSPGLSPGTLTIEGDLDMAEGSVLELEIGGLSADSEHDVLEVTGTTTMAGTVRLKFIDGFAPRKGDAFDLLIVDEMTNLAETDFQVRNLATGFLFETRLADGMLNVTAMNDGVFQLFGDFNGSGAIDAEDIDRLTSAVRQANHDPEFDLTEDGLVDEADRRFWVNDDELGGTFFGDANLDGEFNSGDLVAVFTAGEYEDGILLNSGWSEGDWNGDGEFDSADFVAAFTDGGYELGPKPAATAVPEPGSLLMLSAGVLGTALLARGRRYRRSGRRFDSDSRDRVRRQDA